MTDQYPPTQQPIPPPPTHGFADMAPFPQATPPVSPKKRRTWLHFIGYPVVFLVALGIGAAGGGTDATSGTPGPTVTVTQPAPDAKSAATTAPPVKPSKPAAPTWVKLATLSGSADKKSDTITTHGGKVRLRYTFKGSGVGVIYFLDEGTDLQKDGGIPEAMVTDAAADSVLLRKEAGEYYVSVSSSMRYTVVVEEEKFQ